MTISCMIVDDEPLAVKLLESFVAKTPELELQGSFTDSVEAINAIKEQQPNLLFLDIQMPDLNGMELAHMISSETRVIFTTAFKEYAFESYEVKALDFLLKPIRYNKFMEAVEKAREWFTVQESAPSANITSAKSVFLKVDGEYQRLSESRWGIPADCLLPDPLCLWHERLRDVLSGRCAQAADHPPHDEIR